MPPVAAEELLMLVEKDIAQSADYPLPVLPTDPEDPEGLQPLLFLNRTLPHDLYP